jgi:His-Xaa-Ser system radical SAM maturase HxsC
MESVNMNLRLPEHDFGFRIVSIALDEATKDDLQEDEVDFLWITDGGIVLFPEGENLTNNKRLIDNLRICNNYDVFELWQNGFLTRVYDAESLDNYFFVTGMCNSNCVMCPSPDAARRNADSADCTRLIEIAKHIPTDAKHLTITGGEPFMAGESIFGFFDYLKRKFENTDFLILTNGRIFSITNYVEQLINTIPHKTIIGIPLHGSCPETHDAITRVKNSFIQTVQGIKYLLAQGINVELRQVVCKLNVDDYINMAHFIVKEIPQIAYVSIMASEMTGNAYMNKESVWMPYREAFEKIYPSVRYLIEHEIDVKLYNFPLCTVRREFWSLCEKSISPDKIRFAEVCKDCTYRDACGGVFSGTFLLEKDELKAIL